MGVLDGFKGLFSRNSFSPTTQNSAYDTRELAQTLRSAGLNIIVNGRPLTKDLDAAQIEELYSGIAQAAIQLTAFKVSQLIEEHMAVVDPKDPKVALENEVHPYYEAIVSAPYSNSFFWRAITEYVLTMGNSFVYTGERKMQSGKINIPEKFQILETHHISYVKDRKTKTLMGYKYDKEGTELPKEYLKENVIKVHSLNIFDLENGRGLLTSIVRNLLIEDQMTLLQYAALINGTSIPGIITVDPEMNSDVFENLKASVAARWTGAKTDHSGAPVVLKGKQVDYQQINVQYDKLAMDGLRDGNDNVIRARLGVSKTIMGQEESGVTRDTSETMTENFEDNNCLPLATTIIDAFNQDYINNYKEEFTRKPREMAIIMPDRRRVDDELKEAETIERKSNAVSALVAAGYDPVEACAAVGLDPIKFIGKPIEPVKATSSVKKTKNTAPKPKVVNALEVYCESHGCHTNAFTLDDMTPNQIEYAKAIAAVDGRLLPLYLAALDQDLPLMERETYLKEIGDLMYGFSTETVRSVSPARYAELLALYGGAGAFATTDQTFKELLDQASRTALSHLDTIDTNVKGIVASALKEELGEGGAKRLVEEYFEERVTKYEAQRLAVDQSRRMYGEAKLLSDKQFLDNNNLEGYKILRNYGPNPCPFCSSSEGKRVPLDTNFWNLDDFIFGTDEKGNQVAFKVGYAPVTSGKLHPFCACDYELEIVG